MTDLVAQLVGALQDCLDDSHQVLAQIEQMYGMNYRQDRLEAQRKTIADAEAALSAAKDGGWVAVPVEPTPQMTWAATVTADREWCYHVGRDDAKKLWAAMLAARPFPNPPKEQNT